MQLTKRKYSIKEVSQILNEQKENYETDLAEQRARINELVKENGELKEQLTKLTENEKLILSVLKRAEQTAINLEQQALLEYEIELERLKHFTEKWSAYFELIQSKYPQSKLIQKAVKIKKKAESSNGESPKSVVLELEQMIEGNIKNHPVFDPKRKIADYISATSNSGFNLNDVLNPGDIELEDICRELGLIDSNE